MSGANAVATAPRRNVAREAVAALIAIAAIVGALAGGSWLLQRQGLPSATAPINGSGPRLAANTPLPPGNGNAPAAGACTPATEAAAARRAAASASRSAYVPLPGSWVASAPDLRARFFGMPWWDELPAPSDGTRYSVGTVPDGADDRLDIVRVQGRGVPATATVWQAEYDSYTHQSSGGSSGPLNPATVASAAVTGRPRPQQAAGYDGYIGQFHFMEGDGTRLDATMWVGQVGCDRVVMVFAGLPTRDRQIDQAVAQVLATIDFNAR